MRAVLRASRSWVLLAFVLAMVIAAAVSSMAKSKPVNPVTNPFPIDTNETDKYWTNAKEKVYRSVPDIIAQHRAELAKGINHDKLMHGSLTKRQIALTFDDGPHPKYTQQLLKILKRYKVKATFFLVGEMAEQYPDLVKAEIAGGHSVGNHTYHHVNLTKIPSGYVATELNACGDVLKNITGKTPHLFRPPGGDYNDQVAQVAEEMKYKIVLWTDDPGDYASPGATVILSRVLDRADDGGIILIHDGVQQTVNVLPKIIQQLRSKGYEFVTIDEMLSGK